jgi:hypothetical protein
MKTRTIILLLSLLLLAGKATGQCDISKEVGGSGVICSGSGTNITVAASDATASYQLRDGSTLIGSAVAGTGGLINLPTGNLTATTTFNVLVTGTSPVCSEQLTEIETVTVTSPVGTPSVPSGSSSVCQGSDPTSYTTLASDATSYTWSVTAPNSISGTGTTGTVTWDAGFTGPVTISVTANGCGTSPAVSTDATVNLLTEEPVFTSGATTLCKDSPDETYTATALYSTSIVYSVVPSGWGSGQAGMINPVTGVMNWKSTFSGIATITATASGLCGETIASRAVTVYASAPARPASITGSSPVCQSQSGVSYTIAAVPNTTNYVWSVPAGASISSGQGTTSITVDFSASVTSPVAIRVWAQNNCGLSADRQLSVVVSPTPTATISGTTAVCQGAAPPSVTFHNPQSSPVTITYNINGAGQTTINVGASPATATVTAPTGSAGTYIYTLVSVAYQSGAICSNNITGTATVTVTPIVGTPTEITVSSGSDPTCQLTNGSTTTTYVTTASNSSGFNWSLSNPAAGSINSAGVMTWANGFSGSVNIQVTASGCGTSSQVSRTVSITPAVGAPSPITIATGSDPTCQLTNGTTTTSYSTSSSNSTGFNWSLSNSAAGIINPTSGIMTWSNGFSGSVNIQVTASGCGTSSQITRTVNVTPNVGTPASITVSAGIEPSCELTNGITTTSYSTSASNSSDFTWSINNPSAGSINPASGLMTWADNFSGNVNIQVYATGCNGNSPQVFRAVSIIPSPGTPTPITVLAGNDPACQLTNSTTMTIYSTTASNSTGFNWSLSNSAAGSINAASGVMNWANGFSGNVNIQVTASGCGTSGQVARNILINPLPVPTFITSPSLVRVTSTGNLYSSEAGMNNYVWTVSSGGSITNGGTSGSNTVTVTWNTTGPQSVGVKYTNTNSCTALASTIANVTVYPLPSVSNVQVSGFPAIGHTLTGSYNYTDGSTGSDNCSFRWLRNGITPVAGAISTSYVVQAADFNNSITFEVTPVTSSGTPDTGVPVKSPPTNLIENLAEVPFADQICIEGIRAEGKTLRGKYRFNHSKPEGASTYKWYRDGIQISAANTTEYTLLATDIDNEEEITFEVTPVSSNVIPVPGSPVISNPLVKIPLTPIEYSVAVSSVPLIASPTGGIFSGPGVTNGIFSPSSAGISVTPYTIQYLLTVINTSTSCSQVVSKDVSVVSNTTEFASFKDVYCQADEPDVIQVTGLLSGVTSIGFYLTDPDAIVSTTDWTVTIDPGKMNQGNNVDILYFRYKDSRGYEYEISRSFVIDAVGTEIQILNLSTEYCADAPKANLTVTGAMPSGGTGVWTGTVISEPDNTSASVDVAKGTPGLTYPITYQYTTPLGCKSAIISGSVTVNPLPDPSFALNPFYNIDGGAVDLVPVQSQGIFSGDGVSGDKLYPDIAGTGEHTIFYSITDTKGCSNTKDTTTTIKEAKGTFKAGNVNFPSVICYSDTTFVVYVPDLPSGATVESFINKKNSIIHAAGSTTAEYNVPSAGAGFDSLILKYKLDNVEYWISKVVEIDSIGEIEIYDVIPGAKICNNLDLIPLKTSKPGGIFSGPVIGNNINPADSVGDKILTYKYTNQDTRCSTVTNIPVTIVAAPVVSFVPKDVCIETEEGRDSIFFENKTISSDPVSTWLWVFNEPGAADDSRRESGYPYKTGGLHSVILYAKTIFGCEAFKNSNIDLGIRPDADFTWEKDCFAEGAGLLLKDATPVTNIPIISRTWNINNGGLISNDLNPEYLMPDTGVITVKYYVDTKYDNCADTVYKNIYLRPTVVIPKDGFYYQNFEEGKQGWGKDDSNNTSSWQFGSPDRTIINKANSGAKAWFTKYESEKHGISESSSVVSPCFDFTEIQRPMITLQTFKIFEKNRNGAALQYSIEDSDWKYVGTLDDGINWYNSTLINGKPGGDKVGWTTLGENGDDDYVSSSHALDELSGKKNVKFRIAYGSDGISLDKEGLAFDDIWIGERSRRVLLEHFTNTSSRKGSEATALVNSTILGREKDVISIQYHTNFPADDPFYNDNPGDASTRIFSYGLSRVPYSLIDGGFNQNLYATTSDFKTKQLDGNDLLRRILLNSPFSITVTPKITGGVLTVNTVLTANEGFTSDNLILYLVVTEKERNDKTGALGEKIFRNIFRKFLPDAGGTELQRIWTKNESFIVPEQSWIIANVKNFSDIEVVGFIQNSQTKEVYQVESEILTTGKTGIDSSKHNENAIGDERNLPAASISFGIYPNPADEWLRIGFSDKLISGAEVRIFDFQGAVKKAYRVESGESELFIEDLGLKAGIYLVRISSGGVDLGFRKLIITGE